VTRVVAVVGPTAAGKSALGVALAQALGGEVVNADSMQLYRGMDVGTAKLPEQERGGVEHHLLDVWPVTRTATAADYQVLCREVVDDLLARGVTPVLVGGSGLYLRAALDELEFPGTDAALRAWLESRGSRPAGHPPCTSGCASWTRGGERMDPANGRGRPGARGGLLTGAMPGRMTSYDARYDTCGSGSTGPTSPSGSRCASTPCSTAGLSTRGGGWSARAARRRHRLAGARLPAGARAARRRESTSRRRASRRWRPPAVRPAAALQVPPRPRVHWLDPDRDLREQALRHHAGSTGPN
jgi:hypothetical protein